jgi:zinc-ribbon domain
MAITVIALIGVISGCLAFIPANIAEKKGRDFLTWWFYGFFLFWVALIHAAVLQPTAQSADDALEDEGYVRCPYCAELIRPEAVLCRYCGSHLETDEENETPDT